LTFKVSSTSACAPLIVEMTACVTARMRDCCTRADADAVFDKLTGFEEFTDFLAETSAGNCA
jgi:hypothetical protein